MNLDFDLSVIQMISKKIIEQKQYPILIFNGQMGAGKTTLIKSICKEMGVQTPTSSPTFSLVNEYEIQGGKIFHFDMYRLKSEEEALDFGLEDYLYSGHLCLIEWAEKIPNLLPENHHVIEIKILDDGKRNLRFL
jgi:tRNA threonylcarbamoyladenosine biosynthesis protein TsaE